MLVATSVDCRPRIFQELSASVASRVPSKTVPPFFLISNRAVLGLLRQIACGSIAQAHLQRPSPHPMQCGGALTHRKKASARPRDPSASLDTVSKKSPRVRRSFAKKGALVGKPAAVVSLTQALSPLSVDELYRKTDPSTRGGKDHFQRHSTRQAANREGARRSCRERCDLRRQGRRLTG
jgi:hypothetical protein